MYYLIVYTYKEPLIKNKMRTSHPQYVMMVEFMEKNGDLSKPSGGPRGRHFIQTKWKELTDKLNSDGSGDLRSEEKWRKVWSDLKNNTKKKWAKINRAASGTGGGPALQLALTDLENRVMQIIGVQAATGMAVVEAGFGQVEQEERPSSVPPATPEEAAPEIVTEIPLEDLETHLSDWNTPGTSSQPTVVLPVPPVDIQWKPKPPPTKKIKKNTVAELFLESDRRAREYARERDQIDQQLERERIRQRDEELQLRDFELRERLRQRDMELQLQTQWLEFLKEAMNVLVMYLNKNN